MCIEIIKKIFIRTGKLDAGAEIESAELNSWIKRVLPTTNIELWDEKYRLPPFEEVLQFLRQDYTDMKLYIKDYHDCDDFAVMLWGLWKAKYGAQYTSFGLLLTSTLAGYHAANVFVDDEYNVWLLEPQNDNMWLVEDKLDWQPDTLII